MRRGVSNGRAVTFPTVLYLTSYRLRPIYFGVKWCLWITTLCHFYFCDTLIPMKKRKAAVKRITARIEANLLVKVKARAAAKRWTLNTFIEESLINAVESTK